MKESAQAALSLPAQPRPTALGIDANFLEKTDIHIHFPAGAIPKDGPSAGVTILTALDSLLTGIRVRGDVAMTGEVTLRGLVLPVGGIKEKVLAAHRAGIKRVILPERNRKDLTDVPEQAKKEIEFIFATQHGRGAGQRPGEQPLPDAGGTAEGGRRPRPRSSRLTARPASAFPGGPAARKGPLACKASGPFFVSAAMTAVSASHMPLRDSRA